MDAAEELIESHNERRHNSESVGFVMHETVEEMAEFMDQVYELASEEEFKSLRMQLANGDGEIVMVAKEFQEMSELMEHDTARYRY
jgi:predicted ATP-grasp superfamily ATP-dependent carboligase